MKIVNYEVKLVGELFQRMSLTGKKSRMRTRFVNLLHTYLQDVIATEAEFLVDTYAEKDEDGEIILSEDNPQEFLLREGAAEEFHREYNTLMSEYFHIEESLSNRDMLLSVAESLLETDLVFNGQEAILYDKWCTALEKVQDIYNGEREA